MRIAGSPTRSGLLASLVAMAVVVLHLVVCTASPYTFTDPETGEEYFLPDEIGGAYTTQLPLPDYRGTAFESLWWVTSPPPVLVADVDEDGNQDLVLSAGRELFDERTGESDMVADLIICYGDGTGHFARLETLAESIAYISYAVGDLDTDGDIEIVVTLNAQAGESYRTVLLDALEDGGFSQSTIAFGYEFAYMTLIDVDGDGLLDVSGFSPLGVEFTVLLGLGDGRFSEPIVSPFRAESTSVVSILDQPADFDRDGQGDVSFAVVSRGAEGQLPEGSLIVGFGTGAGTFRFEQVARIGEYLPRSTMTVGDFNGDSNDDLAILHYTEYAWIQGRQVQNQASGLMSVLLGDGGGGFEEKLIVDLQTAGMRAIRADLDGDGIDDIVSVDGHSNAAVMLGRTDLAATSSSVFTTLWCPSCRTWAAFVGDFNGDQLVDVGVEAMEPVLGVRFGDGVGGLGSGLFSAPIASEAQGLVELKRITADFDADGCVDLVCVSSNEVTVLFGDCTGAFPHVIPVLFSETDDEWEVAAGDLNGDGADDLLISSSKSRSRGLRVFWGGEGRAFLEAPSPLAVPTNGAWIRDITVADVDLDGVSDLLYTSGGVLHIETGDGLGNPAPYTTIGQEPLPDEDDNAVYGYWLTDANGDGNIDIVTGAFVARYRLWLNDGSDRWNQVDERNFVSPNQDRTQWQEAPTWLQVPWFVEFGSFQADFDKDGLSDYAAVDESLLLVNLSGREVGLLKFSATPYSQPVLTSRPLVADVNSDGWMDLVMSGRDYVSVILSLLGGRSGQ